MWTRGDLGGEGTFRSGGRGVRRDRTEGAHFSVNVETRARSRRSRDGHGTRHAAGPGAGKENRRAWRPRGAQPGGRAR